MSWPSPPWRDWLKTKVEASSPIKRYGFAIGGVASVALLILTLANPARRVLAQEFDVWQSTCSEDRLESTVCAAKLTTQFIRFKLTVDARGAGKTAQISLRLSEGTLRYAQMKIDDNQTTYDFICLTASCVMDSDSSQVVMKLFETANSAVVLLTTARGARVMVRFKLGGFANALAKGRAET